MRVLFMANTMTDKELIQRIQSDDRDAFDILARERYASLISYAKLFLDRDWAEDVVQDVLFEVWKNWARLDMAISCVPCTTAA